MTDGGHGDDDGVGDKISWSLVDKADAGSQGEHDRFVPEIDAERDGPKPSQRRPAECAGPRIVGWSEDAGCYQAPEAGGAFSGEVDGRPGVDPAGGESEHQDAHAA